MFRVFGLVVLLSFLLASQAAVGSRVYGAEIVVAYERSEYFPWSMPDGTGVDFLMLGQVGKDLGLKFKFVCLNWTDCLKQLAQGKVDALLNASYSTERDRFATYPMEGKDLKVEFRTHYDGYSLYRVTGCKASWVDGKLEGYEGKVAAQKNYSVGQLLRNSGVEVDDRYQTVEQIFTAMLEGKIEAAALMPVSADYVLSINKKFSKIEKAPQQICFKPYFLIFSDKFFKKNKELSWNIWKSIGKLRSSAVYGEWVNQITSEAHKSGQGEGNGK